MMYQCSGVPVTIRNVPMATPIATPTATATPVPTATFTPRPPTRVPTRTPTQIPGPLDFEFELEGFYFTADKGRWGATLVITVLDGAPPFRYTVDEVIELDGPSWPFQWDAGRPLTRSIQVIDARGQKVSKPWYEPSHVAPED